MLVATRPNGLGYRQPQSRRPFLVKRRGMGDCTPLPGSNFVRDNATGNMIVYDPAICGSATGVQPSNTATYIPAGPANFATMPFGNSTTTTFTLDSYLQQRVAGITGESTLALVNEGIRGPGDLPGLVAALAQQYCAAENPPDCGNISAIVAKYSAMLLAAFANVPASQWNPATFTAYAYNGSPAGSGSSGAGAGAGSSPSGSGNNSPAAGPVTVSMKNLSLPGSDSAYRVGDKWQITLTGTPGTPISGGASQDGKSLGTTAFGNLNAQGQMVLTGTMTAAQVGSWSETWNGAPVSFTVQQTGVQSSSGGDNQQILNPSAATGTGVSLPALPDLSGLPSWTWYAVGGLVLWMMLKK